MKKTVSMLLAVLMAAIAVCTFACSAFADEVTTANDDPNDDFVTEATTEATTKETTTKAPDTTATTAAPTEATTAASSEETTKNPLDDILGVLTTVNIGDLLASEPVVTRDPKNTVIDEGNATSAATAAATKKPAKVESNIPSTGSTVLVPAIALLALAAGAVAVVKTKKEN